MDQRIGSQVGNYRLAVCIGRGTFGVVYLAEQVYLGTPVAIKLLHAGLNTAEQHARFHQEAKLLAHLDHPHIVRLLDFGIEEGSPYLISEYAPGGSLRAYLGTQASRPLPPPLALAILAQVGLALSYVHSRGIVHRDLKPENILFGDNKRVLLADFGIARVKQVTGVASTVHVSGLTGFGTPAYMAPEQFEAKGKPLSASDQYALACIAYELLTGQPPFTPDNEWAYAYQHMSKTPEPLRQLNPDLPPHLEQAVLTALAKDPAQRHASVEAFLVALGVAPTVPTRTDLLGDATRLARDQGVEGSDISTLIKQPGSTLTEGEIATDLFPPAVAPTRQFGSTVVQPDVSAQTSAMASHTHSPTPPFQTTGTTRQILRPFTSAGGVPTRQTPALWRRLRSTLAGASALTVARWIFLLAAFVDIPLLLSGFWFGQSVFTLAGTILAVGMCVCGLALNFFTEPWIWLVVFLLLSPLSAGVYAFSVYVMHSDSMNWPSYFGYFLLTPPAGLLYGLCGPARRPNASMAPPFTKKLTLTIWFLGVGLTAVAVGAPIVVYVGLAWVLAAGILTLAQLIRLEQWEWLVTAAVAAALTVGLALLLLGFLYGAFGPTTEENTSSPS